MVNRDTRTQRLPILARPWPILLLSLATVFSVQAATIKANGGTCTLIDAITAANRNAAIHGCPAGNDRSNGGDIIELLTDVTLTAANNTDPDGCPNGLPAIASNITINGNGHTIARSGQAPEFRLLDATNGQLTLDHVTVTGGYMAQPALDCVGGGVKGGVSLLYSSVSGNDILGSGGGIFGTGPVSLIHSSVSGNRTIGPGGGIYGSAAVTLINSAVSDNNTGNYINGEFVFGIGSGGGIYGLGPVKIIDSSVTGNVIQTRVSEAMGGGVYGDTTVTVRGSIIANNIANPHTFGLARGAGIYGTHADITNSTIAGNLAEDYEAPQGYSGTSGVEAKTGRIAFSTIADNQGISFSPIWGVSGALKIIDSIIVRNTWSADFGQTNTTLDCHGGTAVGWNISDPAPNSGGRGFCGAQIVADPRLGPLADNGGPTGNYALLPGSPAIDRIAFVKGVGCSPTLVTRDQRGLERPQGGRCDIGAHEYGGFASFASFTVQKLEVDRKGKLILLSSGFTLPPGGGINPVKEPVTLVIGDTSWTLPPGSFKRYGGEPYTFEGTLRGTNLTMLIWPMGSAKRFLFQAYLDHAPVLGIDNPVAVALTIGHDGGSTGVIADIY